MLFIFGAMQIAGVSGVLRESTVLRSQYLERDVTIDFFPPTNVPDPSAMSLLLINDGQNMEELGLGKLLNQLYSEKAITPLFCAAIHTGKERKVEYGMASQVDYLGRGAKAGAYTTFIMEELIPYIRITYALPSFKEKAFAGFSLGGLSALDIAWNHSSQFAKVGVFSGSLWWRNVDQEEPEYDDDKHRLMHQWIRNGNYKPGLQFFFQCGNMDETKDRNKNGIIDSIDDTLDLINELVRKGYDREKDIHYLEMPDGRHDIATWARALPEFLKWGWSLPA
jgi:enterochelin esterase-like enzyme